jgi:hypothetical protein
MTIGKNLSAFNQEFGTNPLQFVPSDTFQFGSAVAMDTFSESTVPRLYVGVKNELNASDSYSLAEKLGGKSFFDEIDANVPKPTFFEGLSLKGYTNDKYDEAKKTYYDLQVKQMREIDPAWNDVQTHEEINHKNTEFVRATQAEAADVMSRYQGGTAARVAAGFVGGMVGGVALDPVNAATMLVGMPTGTAFLPKILGEAALNAGIEAAQTPNRMAFQEQAGVKVDTTGEATANILMAGAGAGVLTGVFHGLGKLIEGKATAADIRQATKELDDIAATADNSEIQSLAEFQSRAVQLMEKPDSFTGVDGEVAHMRNLEEVQRAYKAGEVPNFERTDLTPEDVDYFYNHHKEAIANTGVSDMLNRISDHEVDIYARANEVYNILQKKPVINSLAQLKKALGYTPKSLTQYIVEKGGIVDVGKELAARDINHKSLVGLVRNPDRIVYKKATDATGGDMIGSLQSISRQPDYVKQEVFDAGYFPDKNSYDEITDSELWDAIAADRAGKKKYDRATTEVLAKINGSDDYKESLYAAGFADNMTADEIAAHIKEIEGFGARDNPDITPEMQQAIDEAHKILMDELMREAEDMQDWVWQPEHATERLAPAPKAKYGESEAALAYMVKHNPEAAFMDDDGNMVSIADFMETLQYERDLEEAFLTCGIK